MLTVKCFRMPIIFLIVIVIMIQPVYASDNGTAMTSEDIEYLQKLMNFLNENYDGPMNRNKMLEGAIDGIFNTMDPFTDYLSEDELEEFMRSLDDSMVGMGVYLSDQGDGLYIEDVIDGSPADKAGLCAGDKIVSINGKNLEGLDPTQTANLLVSREGDRKVLGLQREGDTVITTVTLNITRFAVVPVRYEVRKGIGYIKLDSFSSDASRYLREALTSMDSKGVKKIVLDLRDNPGGYVDEAVAICQNFVPKGLITTLDYKASDRTDEQYFSQLENPNYKLSVLVNNNSASASEILTGAVQDTKSGAIIGTRTYGKAKVQLLLSLLTPEASKKYSQAFGEEVMTAQDVLEFGELVEANEIMGVIKVTMAHYRTPKGQMIDEVGIVPDIIVKDPAFVKGVDMRKLKMLRKVSKPKLNSHGTDVLTAEKILLVAGYNVDTPDSRLDVKTAAAIRKFQKDSNLSPSGVLDFSTQDALNKKRVELIQKYDTQYAKAVEVLASP